MVERRRACHDITALGRHARSNDVGSGMTSQPLDVTHGQTLLGVACHHRLWAAHTIKRTQTVERRWAWHAIIAFGNHTQSNDVECVIPLSPLGSTHGQTTSGVACHHRLWEAQKDERRQAWHANITIGQHTRLNDIGCGKPASPLGGTWSKDVGRGLTSHTIRQRRVWHAIIAFG
uniref:Uncharacterized protein n=1 Tax=Solanum lycopersicum TaxID=4081 RepID=A0A494G8P9_SOLLC